MNANAITKHYRRLTPEERWRLILAASGRGDDAERDRLATAAGLVSLMMPDHFHYAHAFQDLALLTFIELLDDAARYLEAVHDMLCEANADNEAEGTEDSEAPEDQTDAEPSRTAARKGLRCQRTLDRVLAAGFVLRTKAEGWILFCKRLSVPPFLAWEGLPGLERLQRGLALADKAAFRPEGALHYLNSIRPAGEAELTEAPLTVEGAADAHAEAFRQLAERWCG